MIAEDGLIDHVIADGIGVGERKVAESIADRLGKTRHRNASDSNIVGRKRDGLIAIHEEELAGKMALPGMVEVQIADKLVIGVGTRSAKGGAAIRALRCRNRELAIRQLRIQHGKCSGIDRRNAKCAFQRSRSAVASIISQHSGQSASAQASTSYVQAIFFSRTLIRDEEEKLILKDRSTQGPAKLIFVQHPPWLMALVQEEIVGVQGRISKKFPYVAMKLIGSRLCDHVYVRTGVAPIRGVILPSLYLKFLNGIRIGHGNAAA